MDHRVVQFPRPSGRRCKSGVHHISNDFGNGCHAYFRWWRGHIHAVRCSTSVNTALANSKSRNAHQTVLLAIFVLCLFGLICSFPTEWLHRIILWFAPINSEFSLFMYWRFSNSISVIASICICIALLILTPNKQSAAWVFTTVTDGSGWGSKGFSFLLG